MQFVAKLMLDIRAEVEKVRTDIREQVWSEHLTKRTSVLKEKVLTKWQDNKDIALTGGTLEVYPFTTELVRPIGGGGAVDFPKDENSFLDTPPTAKFVAYATLIKNPLAIAKTKIEKLVKDAKKTFLPHLFAGRKLSALADGLDGFIPDDASTMVYIADGFSMMLRLGVGLPPLDSFGKVASGPGNARQIPTIEKLVGLFELSEDEEIKVLVDPNYPYPYIY